MMTFYIISVVVSLALSAWVLYIHRHIAPKITILGAIIGSIIPVGNVAIVLMSLVAIFEKQIEEFMTWMYKPISTKGK